MKKLTNLGLVLITVLSCVGCDQVTKLGAQSFLQGQSPISYFGGLFEFIYAENTGAMLSLGGSLPESYRFILLVLCVGIFLIGATAYAMLKPLNKISTFGLALVIGGGVGNLIDRLFRSGSVVDFMHIKVGPLQTGIFNVADIAITAGLLLLCFAFTKQETTHA